MAQKNETGLFEETIDGEKYEFEKWGAEDSMDALLDIAAIVGKPLGLGAAALFGKDEDGNSGVDKKVDPNIIGTIMESLSERVGTNKVVIKGLIKKLSSERVLCNGAKINFNIHYQDRMPLMFKVVKAALEVQYGNFFGELLGVSGIKKMSKGIINQVRPT